MKTHNTISEQLDMLQCELQGVLLDIEYGDGFDTVCYDTIVRVYNELNTLSHQIKGH
jgi:hypothetical protein